MLIALSPIFIAIIISVSRMWDNRHHPSDVLAGIHYFLFFIFYSLM